MYVYLKVGEHLLGFAIMLSLHDDIRQLVNDDIEGPLRYQRLSEVDLGGGRLLLYITCSKTFQFISLCECI